MRLLKAYRPIIAGIALASVFSAGVVRAEVIFEENFDDLEDFTSTMHGDDNPIEREKGDILPEGWDRLYQGTEWSPETGHPDKHASLEILAENADKARLGKGKSAVFWRESFGKGWNNWASDAQFIKILDEDYSQIYVEFYIRFSENWYQRRNISTGFQSKIFRVGHWDRVGPIYNGNAGAVNPRFIWQYMYDNYGLRNFLNLLQGPPGASEHLDQSGSYNYTAHIKGNEVGGGDPQLVDSDTGVLLTNLSGNATHDQVYGDSETWTKVAFFLKMNSAPGKADGVFRQWINGKRIMNFEDMVWVADNPENKMVGWNYLAIGGNDYFQPFPNEDMFEDWFSIDDLYVATEPPQKGVNQAPRPPTNINISSQ